MKKILCIAKSNQTFFYTRDGINFSVAPAVLSVYEVVKNKRSLGSKPSVIRLKKNCFALDNYALVRIYRRVTEISQYIMFFRI